jgi:hypothetical protein
MRRTSSAGKVWLIYLLILLAGMATFALTYDAHAQVSTRQPASTGPVEIRHPHVRCLVAVGWILAKGA